MTGIQACIFDLDGVLVDTAPLHFMSWRRLARELGADFSLEDNERLKGVSRRQSLEYLLESSGLCVGDYEKEELAARKNAWYVESIMELTSQDVLPGVIEFLTRLKKSSILMAVGSSSTNAIPILESTGIRHFFSCVIDGNQTDKTKPDPQVFLKAAHQLGKSPQDCLVFEDSQAGIDAARTGGMKVVAVGGSPGLTNADAFLFSFSHENVECLQSLGLNLSDFKALRHEP